MEVLITESVSHEDLEGVTLTDKVRFAMEQGFTAVVSSEELLIKKGEEEVFHQKFFGEKWKGVVDFLTAMSKATGLYRIEILLGLTSKAKHPKKKPSEKIFEIIDEGYEIECVVQETDDYKNVIRYLLSFRKNKGDE